MFWSFNGFVVIGCGSGRGVLHCLPEEVETSLSGLNILYLIDSFWLNLGSYRLSTDELEIRRKSTPRRYE